MLLDPKAIAPRFTWPKQPRFVEKARESVEDLEYDEYLHEYGKNLEAEREERAAGMRFVDLSKFRPAVTFRPGQYIDGYAVVWGAIEKNNPDAVCCKGPHYLRFAKGAFARHLERCQPVFACKGHDHDLRFATTEDGSLWLSEDDHGLHIKAIPKTTARLRADILLGLVGCGALPHMSVSWSISGAKIDRDTHKGLPLLTVREAEIVEVTATDNPVFRATSLVIGK